VITLCPDATWLAGAGASQYERLRCQALEHSEASSSNSLAVAFIEHQGLAAWMKQSSCPVSGAATVDAQTQIQGKVEPAHSEWVMVLADLVLGDRQEEHNGGDN